MANIKSEISLRDDTSTTTFLPPAERDRRVKEQHDRLQGLRFRGDEECAHSNYDLVYFGILDDGERYLDLFALRKSHHQEI